MKHFAKHIRRTEAQIRALLRLQEDNHNITITDFCKIHKIHKANFYNWRNKYASKNENPAQFIPVHFNHEDSQPTLFAEIELSSKVTVRLFQRVDPAYFKVLLKS